MSKQYSLFIGRWQPWHPGHRWLIDQRLNEGKNVWVAIRDVEPNEKQPWTSQEVLENVSEENYMIY
jgi:cytidyltransferase-like protein